MVMSTACRYAATSKVPLGANLKRFKLARLQAESSRNMYSLQGLLALMRAVFFEVCQRLTVVSYCIPGSPQCHVASEIFLSRSLALYVFMTAPSRTDLVEKSVSRTTAYMKSSGTRTLLMAFWKKTDDKASGTGEEPSYPCATSARALAAAFC